MPADLTVERLYEQACQFERERDAARTERDEQMQRAESAELGCEIAYRREPTQEEGDAHEYKHDQSMGASHGSGECFVTMGGWTGRRCRVCSRWVWGGPTACERCVAQEQLVERMEELRVELERARRVVEAVNAILEKGPRYTDRHLEAAADAVVDEIREAMASAAPAADVEQAKRGGGA